MKILLDENLPIKLKYDFGENHKVFAVRDMGWLGKKNGELLELAVFNQFDVLLTLHKNLKHQQTIHKLQPKSCYNFRILPFVRKQGGGAHWCRYWLAGVLGTPTAEKNPQAIRYKNIMVCHKSDFQSIKFLNL